MLLHIQVQTQIHTDTDADAVKVTHTDTITDSNKRLLGMPKWVLYSGASVLTFAIIYKLYNSKK